MHVNATFGRSNSCISAIVSIAVNWTVAKLKFSVHTGTSPVQSCRLLRAQKNRYGALEEVGVFSMNEKGLEAVPNPSALFLTSRDSSPGVSSAVAVQMEGTRPMLLEVQALCSPVQVRV